MTLCMRVCVCDGQFSDIRQYTALVQGGGSYYSINGGYFIHM
jgi:hypothetical protein